MSDVLYRLIVGHIEPARPGDDTPAQYRGTPPAPPAPLKGSTPSEPGEVHGPIPE